MHKSKTLHRVSATKKQLETHLWALQRMSSMGPISYFVLPYFLDLITGGDKMQM